MSKIKSKLLTAALKALHVCQSSHCSQAPPCWCRVFVDHAGLSPALRLKHVWTPLPGLLSPLLCLGGSLILITLPKVGPPSSLSLSALFTFFKTLSTACNYYQFLFIGLLVVISVFAARI